MKCMNKLVRLWIDETTGTRFLCSIKYLLIISCATLLASLTVRVVKEELSGLLQGYYCHIIEIFIEFCRDLVEKLEIIIF